MNEVLRELKLATQALHDLTERYAYASEIRSGILKVEQYHQLLLANLTIHRHLEANITKSTIFPFFSDFFLARSQWLEQDLAFFEKQATLDYSFSQLPLQYPAQMIGLLYVVEGSMLGGKMIAKQLKRQTEFEEYQPFHFFEGKKEETKNRWKRFALIADQHIQTSEDQNVTNIAAIQTFKIFLETYKKRGHDNQ